MGAPWANIFRDIVLTNFWGKIKKGGKKAEFQLTPEEHVRNHWVHLLHQSARGDGR